MLDIKRLRESADEVKAALRKRKSGFDEMIDEVLNIDSQRRIVSSETDELKANQNKVSKQIPAMKKAGEDTTAIMAEMKALSEKIKNNDLKISDLEKRQKDILLNIPNTPHESVPEGGDDNANIEVRKFGEPRKFDFEPKPHWDLGANLGILDPETAAKVTGTRFHFLKGAAAKLERAIMNFFLDTHAESGYVEVSVPFLVNRNSMTGTGQLPKFEDDAFKLTEPDYFLIPTAEVPVTNMYRDEILDGNQLPVYHCAASQCFRKEAGSAGRDTRGMIRQHQFQKVELVKFSAPENSYEELEKLTADAEKTLQLLEIPYRVVTLCGGDLGFSSAKTYDIEAWMPSYNKYVEISSCSNFEDYQARRAGIRFKNEIKDKAKFVHTLNGSGLAVGRTVAMVMENYQQADGSIAVPKVLQKYIGMEVITK